MYVCVCVMYLYLYMYIYYIYEKKEKQKSDYFKSQYSCYPLGGRKGTAIGEG